MSTETTESTELQEATAAALGAVEEILDQYVIFPSAEARDAVTLWTAHAHVFYAFESTPRLSLYSRDPGSGKSRVLEVIEHLVPNPMLTLNVTPGTMWRTIEYSAPTLLIDEVDRVWGKKGSGTSHMTLQGILNAGHRKAATIPRCVGTEDVKHFRVFAPVAMAGLGDVPDTIHSRSVRVGMRKRRGDEQVKPFRLKFARDALDRARDMLESWSMDAAPVLELSAPAMPCKDRDADVWEPLVAIGDMAGPQWAERARKACEARDELCDAQAHPKVSPGVQLLTDLRVIFGESPVMFTSDLLAALWSVDGGQWRALDARSLATMLREAFDIRPTTVRVPGAESPGKGYKRDDFTEAWDRFVPADNESSSREEGE